MVKVRESEREREREEEEEEEPTRDRRSTSSILCCDACIHTQEIRTQGAQEAPAKRKIIFVSLQEERYVGVEW